MMHLLLLFCFFSLIYAQNSTCEVVVDSSGTPKPFAFCHSSSSFRMYWTLPEGATEAEIAFLFYTDNGWVGAGFSPDGNMDNSQVLIGWFSNGVGEVHEYQLGDHELGSLATKMGIVGEPVILNDNGRTIITFNRTVNDTETGAIPIYTSSFNYIIYALGPNVPSDTGDVQYHEDNRWQLKVSLTTGSVTGVSEGWISRENGIKVHGILMGITFILLLPLGVLIAKFLKPVKPPLWFQLHRAIQWTGVLLSTFAFVIAINVLYTETYKTHRLVGIICMSLAFWQPANAFLRPHPPKKGEPISDERRIWNLVHHWSGRTCVVLGIINVYVGLVDVVKAEKKYVVIVSVFFGLVCLIGAVLALTKFEETPQPDVKPQAPEAAPFLGAEGGGGADSDDDK